MKWAFKYFSESKKIAYLREQGIMLGSRIRSNRKVYLYMLKDFFVEVLYKDDNMDMEVESIETFTNLDHLNTYLEKEFKAAF